MKKQDIYVYEYCGGIYINLTNRCENRCAFCIRHTREGVGADLWIEREPTAEEVIEALKPFGERDVVFCGYGEPMIRLDTLLAVARHVKAYGGKTRINTNGLAKLYHKRDVVPELSGLIDCVSVSLNAPDAARYDAICHSDFGMEAFPALIAFARACQAAGIETKLSVVSCALSDLEIERCRALAASLELPLRVR